MAIFSLHHSSIGKSTHRAGTAGAHIKYVSRNSAEPEILTNEIPSGRKEAMEWFNQAEMSDRSNGRVADKVMVALPSELSAESRKSLVKSFLEDITKGNQIPWYCAIHQKGEDSHNPHAHILIRDRSPIDGRRVIKTSSAGSTNQIRQKWAESVNKALWREGFTEMIDHRSLKEQGINREPEKHQGWKGHAEDAPRFRKMILQERTAEARKFNQNL